MFKRRNPVITFFEAVHGALTPEKKEQVKQTRQAYRSFVAKSRADRRLVDIIADAITSTFGSLSFAFFHVLWFGVWLAINLEIWPIMPVFDPFPFGLLTMIVSLEAIFLSVFVLISQNRESDVNAIREEVDFQITMQAEQEITKIIHMVEEIYAHLGLKKEEDKELEKMKQTLDTERLEREIKQEVDGK